MRRLKGAAFGRRDQFNYVDTKCKKRIRSPSGDTVEVLVDAKLELRAEDLSWWCNVRSHQQSIQIHRIAWDDQKTLGKKPDGRSEIWEEEKETEEESPVR